MPSWSRAASARAARLRIGAAVAAIALAVVGVAVVSGVVDVGASTCAKLPPARVAADDPTPRTATLVYDASYLHTEVDGLAAWVADVAVGVGAEHGRFVDRCPTALRRSAAVAAGVPAAARPALAAVRRYALEMWNERAMTALLPAVVRRSTVAGRPGWTFALVGPDARSWRYAVADDDGRVIAWQLTGADAQRLFGTGPQGAVR